MINNVMSRLRKLVKPEAAPELPTGLALHMSGGGARAAYQAGVLRYITNKYPDFNADIITGVSAGAINAAMLANYDGTLADATEEMCALWGALTVPDVVEFDSFKKLWSWIKPKSIVMSNKTPEFSALLDNQPLRLFLEVMLRTENGYLTGIEKNLESGRLRAVALMTTNYGTGQTVTWVEGEGLRGWDRPERRSVVTKMHVEHVMASSSLPMIFPATQLGNDWYGDGGIRLSTPLAPALHLGADRILAVSTRHKKTMEEASQSVISGYPPPAQILGVLMNAIFLDILDQDARTLEDINRLLAKIPRSQWENKRPVKLLTIRPSVDLATLAQGFEAKLPGPMRLIARSIGSKETESPDWLSMLMFEPGYVNTVMDQGEEDAYNRADEIAEFVEDGRPAETTKLRKRA